MKIRACLPLVAWLMVILTGCAAPAQMPPATAPTQTPISKKPLIKPGDKIGDMTVEREASFHFFRPLNVCGFDYLILKPHSQIVECTIPAISVIGVGDGWGAIKTKFDSSWEPISWEMYIDDYQIALDEFGWDDISMSDATTEMTLRVWNVIIKDVSPGKHTIRTSWYLETPVDDGWNTYAPGKYDFIMDVLVTERPIYPTMPAVAVPGQHGYTSEKTNLEFLLYLPETYGSNPETKWPLIVYLHDAELRGTNPDLLKGDALPKELETQKDFPSVVLSPVGNGGWDFWSKDEMMKPLITLLEEVQSTYSVDANRIYLTGAGMGGNGVWAAGLRHPEYFAAMAPFDGYIYPFGVPENICDLKDVPVWAFHGENDFMVPVQVEQDLVDALNACGGHAQLTVKPNAVIPLEEYSNPELHEWLLSQTKE